MNLALSFVLLAAVAGASAMSINRQNPETLCRHQVNFLRIASIENCVAYYQCYAEKAYLMECPENAWFNELEQVCDWAEPPARCRPEEPAPEPEPEPEPQPEPEPEPEPEPQPEPQPELEQDGSGDVEILTEVDLDSVEVDGGEDIAHRLKSRAAGKKIHGDDHDHHHEHDHDHDHDRDHDHDHNHDNNYVHGDDSDHNNYKDHRYHDNQKSIDVYEGTMQEINFDKPKLSRRSHVKPNHVYQFQEEFDVDKIEGAEERDLGIGVLGGNFEENPSNEFSDINKEEDKIYYVKTQEENGDEENEQTFDFQQHENAILNELQKHTFKKRSLQEELDNEDEDEEKTLQQEEAEAKAREVAAVVDKKNFSRQEENVDEENEEETRKKRSLTDNEVGERSQEVIEDETEDVAEESENEQKNLARQDEVEGVSEENNIEEWQKVQEEPNDEDGDEAVNEDKLTWYRNENDDDINEEETILRRYFW